MNWVTHARPLPNYRLWLRPSGGLEGEVDLEQFVAADHHPIPAALRDPHVFDALHVKHDTVVWENGFDLALEFLRARLATSKDA